MPRDDPVGQHDAWLEVPQVLGRRGIGVSSVALAWAIRDEIRTVEAV